MEDKLLIATKIKKTIEYVESTIKSYPHEYKEIQSLIKKSFYDLLELSYYASFTKEKIDSINQSLVKIMMLDYYFKQSYKNKIIAKKKYESISNYLDDIKYMFLAWRTNEESK